VSVYTCENGADALHEVKSRPATFFSAIITDLQMPIMDGRALVRALEELPVETPTIVLISAYEASVAQRELNAHAAFEKPFDPFALLERVRAFADMRQEGE
jgi:CheY-like chemotaxis protein